MQKKLPGVAQYAGLIIILFLLAVPFANAQRNYPPDIKGAEIEVYKSVGDIDLRLWIFNPENHSKDDSTPAIIFFFGGGWNGGSPSQFVSQSNYLAKRGMVAMVADYRVKSRHGVKARACVEDAKSALRWVRSNADRLGIDPDRIAAGGGSAGGHLAASTGLLPKYDNPEEDLNISSQPNALVLFNPVLVLGPIEGMPPVAEERLKGLANRLGEEPTTMSPYHNIRQGLPPAVIFHGTNDKTVPFRSVEAFTAAMKEAGNDCELYAFEGAGHGFFNRDKALTDTIAKMDAFFVSQGYLGPVK